MSSLSPLPMTPDQLPEQRLVEVVALPKVPDSFEPIPCLFFVPDHILPRKLPREMTFLGTVEWAWGPRSSRIETYWLHRARRHWVVWIEDRDWTNDPEYKWQVAAYAKRTGVSAEAAVPHLILARWELEMEERQLDHFHFVSNEGMLTVPAWMAIGRAVWR
jgi:hypothetical protein